MILFSYLEQFMVMVTGYGDILLKGVCFNHLGPFFYGLVRLCSFPPYLSYHFMRAEFEAIWNTLKF